MKTKKPKTNIVKRSSELLKIGLLVMFLSIVFLSTNLAVNSNFAFKNSELNKTQGQSSQQNENPKNLSDWVKYSNNDYSVSFYHPSLLMVRETKVVNRYDLFVVFEENKLSKEKGMALGVNKIGLEGEVEKIKTEIFAEGESKLKEEESVDVLDGRVKILLFEPQEVFLEKRSFLIIERGDYTYSFSTVPEQLQKLIDSIEFLE